MSSIARPDASVLDDLTALSTRGHQVRFLRSGMRPKLHFMTDARRSIVFVNRVLSGDTLSAAIASGVARLREQVEQDEAALPDPDAPIRPTLRLIRGGRR